MRRRTLLASTLLVAVPAGSLAGCSSEQADPDTLDIEAFATLAESPGTVLLDVRTPQEFATGHLRNAVNIDFNAPDFADRVAGLDRTATYAVYCRSGNRSGQALQLMTHAGFENAAHLDGGIVAWTAAGRPVVTS